MADHPLSEVWVLCRRLDDLANAATRPRSRDERRPPGGWPSDDEGVPQ